MIDHDRSFYEQLGTNIASRRRARLLSQEQLAVALELSRASVSNIEAGRQKIAVHTLVAAARYLDVMLQSLLPGESAKRMGSEVFVSSAKRLARAERDEVLTALDSMNRNAN